MSLESSIFDAVKELVAHRVFPDVAPIGTPRPYITYQQVGGQALNQLESTFIGKRNARIQMNCWDDTRTGANDLARQVEAELIENATTRATVLGAFFGTVNEDLHRYGTSQDFSIWY